MRYLKEILKFYFFPFLIISGIFLVYHHALWISMRQHHFDINTNSHTNRQVLVEAKRARQYFNNSTTWTSWLAYKIPLHFYFSNCFCHYNQTKLKTLCTIKIYRKNQHLEIHRLYVITVKLDVILNTAFLIQNDLFDNLWIEFIVLN